MVTEPRDHQLTIRIPQRIREALEREATSERRTVADIVNILLENHYPKAPRQPPTTRRVSNPNAAVKIGSERVKIVRRPR